MKFLYTTCFSQVAESILRGSFKPGGYIEVYSSPDTALKLAHPEDEWVVILRVPDILARECVNIDCSDDEMLDDYLYGLVKLSKFKEIVEE
jgi:hypothetical protein